MDDILVLAPTRWKLRKAVTVVNQVRTSLQLDKHPAQTFIGRIAKGFDFLGYHFSPDGLRVAMKTLANFVARVRQLYEHEPAEGVSARLGAYKRRWVLWVTAGTPAVVPRLLSVLVGAGSLLCQWQLCVSALGLGGAPSQPPVPSVEPLRHYSLVRVVQRLQLAH
jgi:hypothetical protein